MQVLNRTIQLVVIFVGLLSFSSFSVENKVHYKLIIFEGSDWCSNCIRFEKNILSDTTFLQKASEWNIEIEKVDFPQRKKQSKEEEKHNASIAEKYHFEGIFPTLVFANTTSDTYQKIDYQAIKTPEDFIAQLKNIISENPH